MRRRALAESRAAGSEPERPVRVQEALETGLRHARNAVAEALLAARAILDAISIAATGAPAQIDPDSVGSPELRRGLATLADAVEDLSRRMASGQLESPMPLAGAILEALDVEIARWEQRSQVDPEARAVLRAFLGLREILWEFGLRPSSEGSAERAADGPETDRRSDPGRSSAEPDAPSMATSTREPQGRVRRIEVEGA